MSGNLPTIAVLTDRYFEYQAELIAYIAEELKVAGYSTLCISAKELCPEETTSKPYAVCNSIYSQVNNFGLHGAIALSGTIGRELDAAVVTQFMRSFSMPKVSMGFNLDKIDSVYFEDGAGMDELMRHLLGTESRKNYAFIRGYKNDPYSLRREAIFRNAINAPEYNNRQAFYLEGNYHDYTTFQQVSKLLSENTDIDCIVAANDVMAASAARAAKAHGYNVPNDIAISGFDDTSEATMHSPALTTVRQPMSMMAHTGVKLLLQQLEKSNGNQTLKEDQSSNSQSISISSELIIRRSTNPVDLQLDLTKSLDEETLENTLNSLMRGLDMPDQWAIKKISGPLWSTLHTGSLDLDLAIKDLTETMEVQHTHWWMNLCDQIHTLLETQHAYDGISAHIAMVNVATAKLKERIWALEMDQSFESNRMQYVKSDMQLAMSSCTEMKDILSAMDRWLGNMKPQRCFLVCYQSFGVRPDSKARLIHQYKNQQSSHPDSPLFDSGNVLPEELSDELSQGLLVFSPVYANNVLFGYLLIDPGEISLLYIDAAAQSIGNALQTYHHIETLESQTDRLKSANQELFQHANYDALTGLANRLQFQRELKERTDNCECFTLLYIDLDGFKLINDTLGHNIGDQLLGQVAQRLIRFVAEHPQYEGFISRLGGDEFTVILNNENTFDKVEQFCEQLLSRLTRPSTLEQHDVSISASIGCAMYPNHTRESEILVQYADTAMYRAKDNGKNGYTIFNAQLISVDTHKLQLAQELRHALSHNELSMHYQPRIDLKTGRILAVESLMRWIVPSEDGLTVRAYPDVFIALAEKIGVISQLDNYALHCSCKQAAIWVENGTPLQVSVNVSVKNLQQNDFVSKVLATIEHYQLDPALIELEVTESAAMTDVDSNIAKLSELKAAGIHLSIDDFGTGYSSLSYLTSLPVNNLKIDRSFVTNIVKCDGVNSADAAIVRSVVALGKSMEFGLIAEGIETREQHEFVRSLGCDQGQGYLYSKAVPAADISAMLIDDGDLSKCWKNDDGEKIDTAA